MAPRKSIYRRLSGRRRSAFGFSQLWLAPDHLLLLKSTRFAENYQRFALADIQAIIVTELPDRTPFQIWLAAAAVLWTLCALAVSSMFAKGFFLITGLFFIVLVVDDILRGPRCRCYLQTAVSRERLAPIARMRAARAFLARVRPAIEAAQGRLDYPVAEPSAVPIADPPPDVPHSPVYLPEIVFLLFLIDAALVLADLRFPHNQIGNALPTTFFAEIVLIVLALVRRGGRDPRRLIYALMIATIACVGWDSVNLGRSFFTLILENARHPGTPATNSLMASWEPLERSQAIFAAAWRIAAGGIGLLTAYFSRASL